MCLDGHCGFVPVVKSCQHNSSGEVKDAQVQVRCFSVPNEGESARIDDREEAGERLQDIRPTGWLAPGSNLNAGTLKKLVRLTGRCKVSKAQYKRLRGRHAYTAFVRVNACS